MFFKIYKIKSFIDYFILLVITLLKIKMATAEFK